jgi:outer membrane receptor protein involved in Fe transport
LLLTPVPAAAQDAQQLTDLTLEELMRITVERVFGASQRLQPVTEAPASVSIVTADDIHRYGYRTLADILRGVRGLYVSDDRNYSYVGVRGFARPGDYNTRVLLLVDGHRVNDNIYDQAGIGGELGIDASLFERVEIIRGPASSLYGTSAFFAVVNIITKSGASLGGGSVALEGGTLGTRRANLAFGRRRANGLDFAFSGTYQRSEGTARLYFPEFDSPATNSGVAERLDDEQLGQFFGRVNFRNWTVTGAVGGREKAVPTASFGTVFNEQQARERTTDRRALVHAQYDRTLGRARVAGRVSFNRYSYDGLYPLPADEAEGAALANYDSAVGTRWGIDARLTRAAPGKQDVTLGLEFFHNLQQDQRNSYDRPTEWDFAIERSSRQGAIYIQDQIRVRPRFLLDLGVRYDRYRGANRVSPRAAAIFAQSPNQSFKYLYGNAFRAPNAYELEYHTAGVSNIELSPESIDTHEIVWERYTGEWLRTSASTYWYNADRLITLRDDPTTFDGLSFSNVGRATAEGVELEGEIRLKNGAHGLASYTFQHATDRVTETVLTNSPRHVATFRVSMPSFGADRSFTSIELQRLSGRRTLAGSVLDGVLVAHVTLTGRVRPGLELVASIRNLLDQRYADPASDEHVQDSIPQDGRTFRMGVRWTFLAK